MLQPEPLSEAARAFPGLNHQALEGTVLATIINRKVGDVAALGDIGPQRASGGRSLTAALKGGEGRRLIMECKRSSPSLGDFCQDFDLDRIVRCYNRHAAAISVLCERHFFKGSLEFLTYVRDRTELPVLCKDFIIDRRQLDHAARAGADAALLMLSVLGHERYLELYEYAKGLGLEILTEASNEEELRFAAENRIPLVGINNRDMRTLRVDLDRASSLAPLLPKGTVVVSESGVKRHQDLTRQKDLRCFLIGSALCADPDFDLSALRLIHGMNKVCGITTEEGLEAAISAQAALAGFIFHEGSPRNLSRERAQALMG
nr:bifunctional indole-3-glycerol phosphate synthase/phosphoribosylanthranilate isomerase [Succinivibrionaceae bacterium]